MQYRFTITYNGVDTVVPQPQNWNKFESEIDRKFTNHGAVFEYTSGTLKLGFSGQGRTIFEDAFRLEGFDAQVNFKAEERADKHSSYTTIFTGVAVMENREYTDNFFEVDFENSTFKKKVSTRQRTKIDLGATVDLDGNALSGSLTEQSSLWNSMRLKSDYIADYRTGAVSSEFTSFTGSAFENGTPGNSVIQYQKTNFIGIIDDELEGYNILTEGLVSIEPSIPNNYNLVCPISGTLTFTYTYKFQLESTVTLADDPGNNTAAIYELVLRHDDSGGTLINEYVLDSGSSSGASPLTHDFGVLTLSGSKQAEVSSGDYLFFYLKVTGDGGNATTAPYSVEIDSDVDVYHNSRVSYSILKSSTTQTVTSYLIHDIIERMLYIISGEDSKLYSEFLGVTDQGYSEDGCGGKTLITNGARIRGITNDVSTSLKEMLDSIKAIWGLGYGFEYSGGAYRFRIEPIEHFYSGDEILDVGSPATIKEKSSYKEETFDGLVFNSVDVGYSRFSRDEDFSNNIDDFLTRSEYSLPLFSVEGKYSQICKYIASGRLVQATFEQTDLTKRWKYDDSVFIVSAQRSASNFVPENDEPFESVSGVDDKSSTYNIRFAPVYMFLNHALIVNSALLGKPQTSELQNNLAEISKDFRATFSSYEECLLGDIQRIQRGTLINIQISDNYVGYRLFNPVINKFTVAMNAEDWDEIVDAMENNSSTSSKNLGYITYRDNEGAVKNGYLINGKRSPIQNIAELTCIEKADNYGI